MARLRVVALYCTVADQSSQLYAAYAGPAGAAAKDLKNTPQLHAFATAAELLVARLRAKRGDGTAIDRMIENYRAQGVVGMRPVLVYQPPLKGLDQVYDGSLPGPLWVKINSGDLVGQWADIAYWVRPDGSVGDVSVLRGGIGQLTGPRKVNPKFDERWTVPAIMQISGRRFAPLPMDKNSPGVMRVERYTLTAWLTDAKNSRIQVSGAPRYEMLDLSVDPQTIKAAEPASS